MRVFLIALLLASLETSAYSAKRSENLSQEEELFGSASQLFQESPQDKAAAIDAFERFLKRFPDSPRAMDADFMMGESYFQQALAVLKVEAASKKTVTARLLAPRNQAALQSLSSARDAYRRVVGRGKKSGGLGASAQYRIGETHYNEKDWGAAVEELRKVEKDFAKSYLVPESWMGIIFADLALEQFSQAESNLFLLGETYPHYLKVPEVLYAQGIVSLHKGDYAASERALRQVPTPEAAFYLGKTYLLSKRPFLAATAFERLVRDYPLSELKEEAEFFIGDSFFLAKDFDGAITKYQRFLERYPDSRLKVAALFRIGSSHFQKKSWVDARANFQAVLDRYPQDFFAPLAQYFIAESYLTAGQMREALFAYTKVITQFPETIKISPLAHYKLAWSQHQVGDYAQAAQTCSNFLALYPTHVLAKNVLLILGNAQFSMKRYSEAVTAWQRIIDLAPTSEVAEQALYSILEAQHKLKNYDSILTSYQFIFRHLPPSQSKWRSLSYLYASEAYLALNQVDEAQAIYEMILKVYPNDAAAYYSQDGLAWVWTYRGDDERALAERQKLKEMMSVARSTFVFSGRNELGIADSMFNQKNYEDAFQLYDRFARENPQAPEAPAALFQAGMSLYHSRYYTQAVEAWRRLQTDYPKAPETPQAVFLVADTLFRAQKYGESIAAYRDITARFPKHPQLPQAYLRIAQSAFNAKDDAGTLREAQALVGKFPTAPEATDALDLMEGVFDRSPKIDFKEALEAVIAASPRQAVAGETLFRMGLRHFAKKDYPRASEAFQRFSVDYTDNPQLGKAQFMLAEAFFEAGKSAQAAAAYQRFLNNFPRSDDTSRALFHVASAHYNLKQYAPATEYYQRLIEEYPESPFAKASQYNLGLAFKALGRMDSAQEAYSRYLANTGDSDPTALGALWEMFAIQKDRKDYGAALDTLKRLQDKAGPGAEAALEAVYNAGDVYVLMGRPDEAAAQWERLKAMKPAQNAFRINGLIKLGEILEKTEPGRAAGIYEDISRSAPSAQLAQSARERAAALRSKAPKAPKAPKAQPPGGKDGSNAAAGTMDELIGTQVMPSEEPRSAPAPKRRQREGGQ